MENVQEHNLTLLLKAGVDILDARQISTSSARTAMVLLTQKHLKDGALLEDAVSRAYVATVVDATGARAVTAPPPRPDMRSLTLKYQAEGDSLERAVSRAYVDVVTAVSAGGS